MGPPEMLEFQQSIEDLKINPFSNEAEEMKIYLKNLKEELDHLEGKKEAAQNRLNISKANLLLLRCLRNAFGVYIVEQDDRMIIGDKDLKSFESFLSDDPNLMEKLRKTAFDFANTANIS